MSSRDIAVSVRGLWKSYTIAHEEKHSTLAETWLHRLRNPLRGPSKETFDALKDVSFDIERGGVLGIIGRNGAGKSTLLKILSRITQPTSGEIRLRGRVGSLLEVGTGFHSELTGRENIFLNGAILGMTRSEIRRQFDAILDFAGVEKFLDTPVKRYSSGMYVRLAFAVAAHLNPEILIVDEVLAVGDAGFQKKCLGKMREISQSGGRTVLFVSHNMAAVKSLCTHGVVLHQGSLVLSSSADNAISTYLQGGVDQRSNRWTRDRDKQTGSLPMDLGAIGCGWCSLTIEDVVVTLTGSQPYHHLLCAVTLRSHNQHLPAFLAIDFHDPFGGWIMQATPQLTPFIFPTGKEHQYVVDVSLPPLIPGTYAISVWIGASLDHAIDWAREVVRFDIVDSPVEGRTTPHISERGFCVPVSRVV